MKSRTISVLLSVAVLMTAAHPISAAAEAAESNFAVPEPCVTEETAETDTCDYTFAQFFTGEGVDITALEADAALNPSLHNIWMDEAYTAKSSYYGKGQHAVLVNGSLFIVGNGKATLREKNVRGFAHIEPKDQAGTVMPADLLLRSDGTLLVNDKAIEDVKFSSLERDFAVTSDGRAFAILPYYDNFFPILILKDFKYFVPDYPQFKSGMNHYRALDLPFEEAFGPMFTESDKAAQCLCSMIESRFALEEPYKGRLENFFFDFDGNCAENLYQLVQKYDEEHKKA